MSKDLLTGDIEQSPEASRRKTGVKHLNKRPMIMIIGFGSLLMMVAAFSLKTMSDRQTKTVAAAEDDYEAIRTDTFVDTYLADRGDGTIQNELPPSPPKFLDEDPDEFYQDPDSFFDGPVKKVSLEPATEPVIAPAEDPMQSLCGTPQQCELRDKLMSAVAAEKIRLAQLKRSQLEDAAGGSIRVNFNRSGSPSMGMEEEKNGEAEEEADQGGAQIGTSPSLIKARGESNSQMMFDLIGQRIDAASQAASAQPTGLGGSTSSAIGGLLGGIGNSGGVGLGGALGSGFQNTRIDDLNRQNEFLNQQQQQSDYLEQTLTDPRSDIELKAGTLIQASLLTGINSDLPGQIIAQVTRNVWDTRESEYVLIPQGTRLIGRYDSGVSYGQKRVLVAWDRLIYPNGQSLRLEGMNGVDRAGQSGFKDKINNHYFKTFSSVILFSVVAAGVAKVDQNTQDRNDIFSAESEFKIALGKQISQLSNKYLDRALNLSPTLSIRQGYVMNVMLDKDIVLPPYADMHRQLSKRYLPKREQ